MSALKPRNSWYYRRITYNSINKKIKIIFLSNIKYVTQSRLPLNNNMNMNNMNDTEG